MCICTVRVTTPPTPSHPCRSIVTALDTWARLATSPASRHSPARPVVTDRIEVTLPPREPGALQSMARQPTSREYQPSSHGSLSADQLAASPTNGSPPPRNTSSPALSPALYSWARTGAVAIATAATAAPTLRTRPHETRCRSPRSGIPATSHYATLSSLSCAASWVDQREQRRRPFEAQPSAITAAHGPGSSQVQLFRR